MTEEDRSSGAPQGGSAEGGGPRRRRALRPFYNWLSITGAVIAIGGVTGALFLSLLDVVLGTNRTYPGVLLIPFLLPALLGLVLVGAGILREQVRRKRGVPPSITPSTSIDLAQLTRRRPFFFLVTGTIAASLAVFGGGFGTLSAVEFTESNVFCGEVCHAVMNPEYQTFHTSPHSRLDCVDCHTGGGAEGYLFAKLNGLGQLWSMFSGDYDRPISTSAHDMRQASDLCESCHMPERLIGHISYGRNYFLADEENTPVSLQLLVDVGGTPRSGLGAGIHFHMFLGRKIEYVARDKKRQKIAWVKMTRPDGSTVVYEDEVVPLSDEERADLPVRSMDCLDCHNRPAHRFLAPTDAVNEALAGGAISRDLPYIKREAVVALDGDYETTEAALPAIEQHLREFYEEEEPDVLEEHAEELATAVHQVQAIYRETIFPEVKALWSSHPDNSGHRDWPGCFRCHNQDMVSEAGDAIFQDCDGCHMILWQGENSHAGTVSFPKGQQFLHPEDGEPFDEYTDCTECHTGGAELYE